MPLVRSVYAVSTNDGGLQQDGGAVVLAVRPLSKGPPCTRVGDGAYLIRDENELHEIQEGFRVACDGLILPLLTTKFLEGKGSVEMMYLPSGMREDYLFDQSIGGFCVKVSRMEDEKEIRVTLTASRRYDEEAAMEDPMSESPWEVAVERPAKRYRTAGSALRDVFDKRNS